MRRRASTSRTHRTAVPGGLIQLNTSQVRETYRRLCRLLHPDAAGELSPASREIWHLVQEAYAERDAVRLDTLLAQVEQGAGGEAVPRSVAELPAMAQHYRRALRELREVIREARLHPGWQFRLRDDAGRGRLEGALRHEIGDHLARMQREVARMRAALQPRGRREPKAGPRQQNLFPFD